MTINNTSTIATEAMAVAPAAAAATAVGIAATAPAMAAVAGGARDASCLDPLVCFISYFYFNTLMFILALGTIEMAAPPAAQQQQQEGLEMCHISSPW